MTRRSVFVGFLMLALLLSACGAGEETTATPEVPENYVPMVSVTGEVVPEIWSTLGSQVGGRVIEVVVEMGDAVETGTVLIRLDDTDARFAVLQAAAQLASAEANLANLKASPRPEEVAAAEAAVKSAEAALQKVYQGAGDQQLIAARADLRNAEAELRQAQGAYDAIKWMPGASARPEALRLERATNAYEAAKARYEDLAEEPSYADVQQAKAGVEEAEAQLELVKSGAQQEAIDVAAAEVQRAEAALEQAEVALERTEIVAPFDGTVGMTHVRVGEFVSPGQPLVTLGDLSSLRVETTDLDEIDVAQVEVGEEVTLTFDAFPDRTYTGTIARIAPMADQEGGGVNYTVYVEMEEIPEGVRWGMTAFVDVQPD